MPTNNQTKQRDSNLELYRIILMLLIVAHHYLMNSGLFQHIENEPLTGKTIFYYLFCAWGKTGINCFVLITGYFMCKSEITLRKFLKLILEVEFYRVIFYLIFILSGYEEFTWGSLKRLFPINSLSNGFTPCFILFYLCIPFLNILIRNMTRRQHQLLICLTLFIYTIIGTIPHIKFAMNYVSWFCVLYFISSYIRLYNITDCKSGNWGGYAIISLSLSAASILFFCWINRHTSHYIDPYYLIQDSNRPLALLTSICAFMYFKNLKVPYNKYINMIGASIFGVLLIHANSDTMRQWLWKDTLNNVGHYNDNTFWLHAILCVLIVFTACIIIDRLRIITLERWFFRWYDAKAEKKLKLIHKS